MNITESALTYKRYLKRKNCSAKTVKNYLHRLKQFMVWVAVPVEQVSSTEIKRYIDFLLEQGLQAHTINCHLSSIRGFYDYLKDEEELVAKNPVIRGLALRVPHPLPKHVKDNDIAEFLKSVKKPRDLAIFMLMLRCGLRVDEVANLTLDGIDYTRSQILVKSGKGAKDRVVFISHDAAVALARYLQIRLDTAEKKVFLVEKGKYRGKPISVRGIQKRIEYYSKKSGLQISCHQLRHTMATQLLNADADLVSIQEILGHTRIKTTQRYSKLSNLKAERDYHGAMEKIMAGASQQGIQLRGTREKQ
ncbi:MAG: tyrosine-type recombinase/integrase [ANME-2 cluster archaeon]|nr:tyrosine-type recombinase/integrase [ANME-2 cluster archaeon]